MCKCNIRKVHPSSNNNPQTHIAHTNTGNPQTSTLHLHKSVQCETIHENNAPFQILKNGYIFKDYEHTWNNMNISGPKLILQNPQHPQYVGTYYNHKQQLRKISHNQHSEKRKQLLMLFSNQTINSATFKNFRHS